MHKQWLLILVLAPWFSVSSALAGDRLKSTGGVSTIEGAAGGGLVPWATISGYSSTDQLSVQAFATQVVVDDYRLRVTGLSASYNNRVELSFAQQNFRLDALDQSLEQNIFGAKVRLAGSLLYTAMPQISVGLQYKVHQNFDLPEAVGARSDSDLEAYLSASKVYFDAFFGRNLLLNATVRATRANQTGLLGFGSEDANNYRAMLEGSAALLVTHDLALGVEYRQKPDQLAFAREDDWFDVFAAWFINKNVSLVAAYADLGSIAGQDQQRGWYLSVQGAY